MHTYTNSASSADETVGTTSAMKRRTTTTTTTNNTTPTMSPTLISPASPPTPRTDHQLTHLTSSTAAAPSNPPTLRSRLSATCQRAALRILKLGPVPRHVAFIMDGNRRFAKKLGVHAGAGHAVGSEKLEETLQWCLDLGVRVVTVYAFSIENFKRPQDEVSVLMDLARVKLDRFARHSAAVSDHSVRIRVLGDWSLLPSDVRAAARRAEAATRHHTGATLNICCPYTSRHEMARSIATAVRGVEEGHLVPSDVDEDLLNRLMGTGQDPDLDVLVRTSGEKRLSDFMLWQAVKPATQCWFLDVLWPEFTFWHMVPVLLAYQVRRARSIAARYAMSKGPFAARLLVEGSEMPSTTAASPSPHVVARHQQHEGPQRRQADATRPSGEGQVKEHEIGQDAEAKEMRIEAYIHYLQEERAADGLAPGADGVSSTEPVLYK